MAFTNPQFEDTIYEYDHFSGAQVNLYIGDVLIDEATAIQFRVTQSKRPIYGYASQHFNAVSKGNVLVEGLLVVNFKEAGYMIEVVKRYGSNNAAVRTKPNKDGIPGKKGLVLAQNIEFALRQQKVKDGSATDEEKQAHNEFITRISQTGTPAFFTELAALPDQAFEDAAEAFQNEIWLENITNRDLIRQQRRPDEFPPFDVFITYGDVNNPSANHTVKKLIECHLTGSSQTIEINGEPILEAYPFFAKDLV